MVSACVVEVTAEATFEAHAPVLLVSSELSRAFIDEFLVAVCWMNKLNHNTFRAQVGIERPRLS